jgi:RNA polymerase sigma-70 factor (ECF subfamily)
MCCHIKYHINFFNNFAVRNIFLQKNNSLNHFRNRPCNKDKFKPWIIAIAGNKINDFYRGKAKELELPLDENILYETSFSRVGLTVNEVVNETLSSLVDKEKQIPYLYYFKQKPQKEIAKALGIPLGTVKSRLHKAKQNFRTLPDFT